MRNGKIGIGINGVGVIGRITFRIIKEEYSDFLEIIAINDLSSVAINALLLKHDSIYGKFKAEVRHDNQNLIVNDQIVQVFQERDPEKLPWSDMGVDIVIESTGFFADAEKAKAHIHGGKAKKVIISAPAKGAKTIVMGVNQSTYDPMQHHILSNASCTTNCLGPLAQAVHNRFRIIEGFMTTIHSYTNDQRLADQWHDDPRRARAAAMNIIPTSTGAARAIGLVLPELEGKLDGVALRVPTPIVSIVDLVCNVEATLVTNPANKEEREKAIANVNEALRAAADGKYLVYSEEDLVSSDMIGNPASSIIDSKLTNVIGTNTLKVFAWYDNVWGFSCRLAELVKYVADRL